MKMAGSNLPAIFVVRRQPVVQMSQPLSVSNLNIWELSPIDSKPVFA
ncbi:hypothetical protein SAMN05444169_2130 [Bradyrhizobium erythrophlei]|uniref:Uncharacterized protein n=1 Tax=Bradyrhizobium erythrophlei TaxID=1437360 RepID=A0A1M5JC52_9BRAD|nr:hypothetical protein SAMN05444169_2130 [Bradyrhizobium erythrophlei]